MISHRPPRPDTRGILYDLSGRYRETGAAFQVKRRRSSRNASLSVIVPADSVVKVGAEGIVGVELPIDEATQVVQFYALASAFSHGGIAVHSGHL